MVLVVATKPAALSKLMLVQPLRQWCVRARGTEESNGGAGRTEQLTNDRAGRSCHRRLDVKTVACADNHKKQPVKISLKITSNLALLV